MREPRIGDHALIGDCRSAALVTDRGCVDWLCWPRFDSAPVFARLLDPRCGGFTVAPAAPFVSARRYLPESNVLETRFTSPAGVVSLVDLMPVAGEEARARELQPEREILRIARCTAGEVELEVVLEPRPRFGRARRRWRDAGELGLHLVADGQLFVFRSEPRLGLAPGGDAVRARVKLRAGETARFSFTHSTEAPAVIPPLGARAEEALSRTVRLWQDWARRARYAGPFRDMVIRSALVLKLLTYAPSGAIVAAPTTSLPERLGGPLNWDYRYCWLRDASFTARALFGLGYREEAEAFVGWLLHATRLTRPALRIMYDVFGRDPPEEVECELAGYASSVPVRVGNAARDQLQLDVYGEVIDAAAQLVCLRIPLPRETGRMLAAFGKYVCEHWRDQDNGIWEPRGGRRHHTYSKVMCWVALDRLLELHARGHLRGVDPELFARARAELAEAIRRQAWSERLQSYVQAFGDEVVDAALLQLPWFGFVSPGAARMRSTFRRIESDLGAGRGLLYRYPATPGSGEGAFGICGFWAAEYLALGGGTLEEAHARIAALLSYANDVGLFAEEVDPATGDALGNFPQAFTHIGLVNACLTLQNRLTGREQLAHRWRLPEADRLAEWAR